MKTTMTVRSALAALVMMPFLYSGAALASEEVSTAGNDQMTNVTSFATLTSNDVQTDRWGRPRMCWRRGRFGRPHLVPCNRGDVQGQTETSMLTPDNSAFVMVADTESTDLQTDRWGGGGGRGGHGGHGGGWGGGHHGGGWGHGGHGGHGGGWGRGCWARDYYGRPYRVPCWTPTEATIQNM